MNWVDIAKIGAPFIALLFGIVVAIWKYVSSINKRLQALEMQQKQTKDHAVRIRELELQNASNKPSSK